MNIIIKANLKIFALFSSCIIANAQNEKVYSPAKDNIVYFVNDGETTFISEKIVEDSIIINGQNPEISSDSIKNNGLPMIEDCPKLSRRSVLCDSIQSRRDDTDPNSDYDYKFERDMDSIVCADPTKESREEINKKIHDVFVRYGDELYCDSLSFDVPKGNFLKFAVTSSCGDFLDKAVREWKVPLNRIDQGDGRTPLDYIKNEMDHNKGSATESVLKGYYTLLRKYGAKHKSELSPEELKRNGKPNGHKDCPADAPCKK
ncbi:MAG: hypothetical protein J0I88_02275 [Chryseobacterium sp.]|nr:hypothetical protein [Chryseobacterium sp.]OJX28170.1 MAG: hypothetical protein BGO86_02295 [Chryseobacterium sp. 36-9]